MWVWGFGRAAILPFYRLALRIRVEGTENVPKDGGIIMCSNHIKIHDPALLGMLSPRPIRFMAKEELFKTPILSWFFSQGGAFPVKRGTPDRAALKYSLELLANGECFGIFPEGTRSKTGQLGKAEPGTAYLALKSGASVIPVGFSGSYKLFSSLTIRFGMPVNLEPFKTGKLSSENLEAAGEAIMSAIRAQLEPPETPMAAK